MTDAAPLPPGLYLVSTPIGAARDITLRALDILGTAEVLAAEDTRSLRHLMQIHAIAPGPRPMLAYHDHNGARMRPKLLAALAEGQVDAACLSFESYLRAVDAGVIAPDALRVLVRSAPIPNPPIAMHTGLPDALKLRLREGFDRVHTRTANPEMIRGYGGRRVDRYDAAFPESAFDAPADTLSLITDEVRAAILRRAGTP